jgi:hypothetical protein
MRRLYSPLVAALIVAAAGGGFGVGRLSVPRGSTPASGPGVDQGDDVARELGQLRTSVEGMQRSVARLSERVAGLAGAAVAAPSANGALWAEAGPPPREPTAEEKAARLARDRSDPRFREGEAVIAEALGRGTWTARDIARFRELHRQTPELDWVSLMQRIDWDITTGKLRPDLDLVDWH